MQNRSRQTDRLKVLEFVEYSIQRRIDRNSVEQYVVAAKEYAMKYGIEALVEDWLMEGRNVFIPNAARHWAESLP